MHAASLVRGAEHLGSGGVHALVVVGHDEPNHVPPVGVHADNHDHGDRDDPARLPDLQAGRVDPQVQPGALDWPRQEGAPLSGASRERSSWAASA